VFYDIGANAGVFSVECALKFRNEIRVHAFEPQPSLAQRIRDSAVLNGISGLSVHEILLSDRAGEGNLFVTRQSVHASLIPREDRARVIRRELIPLDDLIAREHLPPPSLIKIDVEGAELQVFRGAARNIAAHRPVIIFEADQNMRRFGYDHAALFGALTGQADYLILRVASDGSLVRLRAGEAMEEANYIALPPDRLDLAPPA
jgi:FkbM family methyltransferase